MFFCPSIRERGHIRPCLKRLTNEEKGILFEAILDYGEYALEPELDGVLGIAWDFIQPRLDRDRERYEQIAEKRKAAANTRWGKEKDVHMDANGYNSMQTMPTTTPTPTTTSTSTSTATSTSTEGEVLLDNVPNHSSPPPKTEEQTFEEMRAKKTRELREWSG